MPSDCNKGYTSAHLFCSNRQGCPLARPSLLPARADEPGPADEVVSDKGLTVLVDRKASLFLIGTVMDYETKALASGFTFTNPNEKGRCGCGESFHV